MKALVLFSGGLDSTVLATQLKAEGSETRLLSIDYGQRHARELKRAEQIAQALELPHQVLRLPDLGPLLGGSSLTDEKVELPEGHYAEESMKATVVPNRNMILLSVAAGWAISSKYDRIAYAAHSGDHAIYPDCRNEFAEALDGAIRLADWHEVSLYRPFVDMTKADIVSLGAKLGVPFKKTWSCYKGQDLHCGRCGTCVERREAFYLAGVDDPTTYAEDAPTVQEMVASDWKI